MIALSHNIDAVIADLQAAQKQIADDLMPHVMQHGKYLEWLRSEAKKVLGALCEPEERHYIDDIANAVVGYTVASGMAFEIVVKPESEGEGGTMLASGDIGYNQLKPFEADIAAWVAEFKEKDATDRYKGGRTHTPDEPMSNTVIARRIMAVINGNRDLFFSTDRPGHGVHDPEGLWQYLVKNNPEFAQRFGKSIGLTELGEARCIALMAAVLDYWHDAIGVKLISETIGFLDKALDKPVP